MPGPPLQETLLPNVLNSESAHFEGALLQVQVQVQADPPQLGECPL